MLRNAQLGAECRLEETRMIAGAKSQPEALAFSLQVKCSIGGATRLESL